MAKNRHWPLPEARRFKVLVSFVRYEGPPHYLCGAMSTYSEESPGSWYAPPETFTVRLRSQGTGVYCENGSNGIFAFHELDALVKVGLLEELVVVRKNEKIKKKVAPKKKPRR